MKQEKIDNMIKNTVGDVTFLTFPTLSKFDFLRHGFSTKEGGVSKGIFSSMNLSFGRGDSDENVRENYVRLGKAIGVNTDNYVFSKQVHETNVERVTASDRGNGIWKPNKFTSCDGIVTNEKDVVLVTHYADCVPLYFVDPKNKAIGLTHGGWRGTVKEIAKVTVEKMVKEFGSDPKDLVVCIGPSAGQCCYEVDDVVVDAVNAIEYLDLNKCYYKKENGRYMINLWEVHRQILAKAGVKNDNIHIGGVCTICHSDLLFSHRATNGKRGGLAAIMSLV